MTVDLQNLNSHCEYQGPDTIKVGDGTGLRILHTGSSSIQTPHKSLLLNKILHVPSITQNLLTISQFTRDNNVYFEFHPSFFVVKDIQSGKELLHGSNKGGLYCLKHTNSNSTPSVFISSSFDTWHRRLGHPMMRTVHQVVSRNSLPLKNKRESFCSFCPLGKSHKLSFPSSSTIYKTPLELVVSDIWGPSPIISNNQFRYYIHFLNVYSHFIWIFPLKLKSNVQNFFLHFKSKVENLLGYKIKRLQTDGGGEYQKLKSILENYGIEHRISCPHTQEQNGLAERRHRHIVETGLTLMATASVPLSY